MKNQSTILILGILCLVALSACAPDAQLPNPASQNCVDEGGELEIRNTADGQIGVCVIDGAECEEWALYRGEGCVAPDAVVVDGTDDELDDDFVSCPAGRTDEPVACTMEYMPVCGKQVLNTGEVLYQTYGNACGACAEMKVVGYTPGECPEPKPEYVTCEDPRPEACTREYNPVCAQVDTGIRCITEPCPATEERTYSNGCTACSDADVYGYTMGACVGTFAECVEAGNPVMESYPEQCRWPDGTIVTNPDQQLPPAMPPLDEREMAICDDAPEWMPEDLFDCVDECPEGYDSYTSQIAVRVCIERMDEATFTAALVCDEQDDCTEGQSCVLADRATSGEWVDWDNRDDGFRCLPQTYVNYRLHTNGATVLDDQGRESTMIA